MVPCAENLMATAIRKYSEYGVNVGFKYSGLVSFAEIGTFASKFYPAPKPIFKFLGAFDNSVWLLTIIAIIVLSIVSSVNHKINTLQIIWNYFELLFSKSIQKCITNSSFKLCLGVWMISALYLSMVFTSRLLDYMIKAVPIVKLDELQRLTTPRIKTVFGRDFGPLYAFISAEKTELAKKINAKFEAFQEINHDVSNRLRDGSSALFSDRLNLIFMLADHSNQEISDDQDKLINILHISKGNGGFDPYFLAVTENIEGWVLKSLNLS